MKNILIGIVFCCLFVCGKSARAVDASLITMSLRPQKVIPANMVSATPTVSLGWQSYTPGGTNYPASLPKFWTQDILQKKEVCTAPLDVLCSYFDYSTVENVKNTRWMQTDILLIGHGYDLPKIFGGLRLYPEARWMYPECDNSTVHKSSTITIGFSLRKSFSKFW